ncbi:hypothetical protein OPV22_024895 [Ensete ventricosum]|uniref:Uncharacterized protein n=1 Tax=Ensete ventricosum TaxID=4639 RepID=A0AAV8QG51_ENSVE|nr:hypothetical protein OPV22_024895 [Ensete ventricosum]
MNYQCWDLQSEVVAAYMGNRTKTNTDGGNLVALTCQIKAMWSCFLDNDGADYQATHTVSASQRAVKL